MPTRGFLCCLRAKEDQSGCHFFMPQSRCEKLIVNMVGSDYGMPDTMVRVSTPWEVESEEEYGAILTT